jgi:hypothetical protein
MIHLRFVFLLAPDNTQLALYEDGKLGVGFHAMAASMDMTNSITGVFFL